MIIQNQPLLCIKDCFKKTHEKLRQKQYVKHDALRCCKEEIDIGDIEVTAMVGASSINKLTQETA